MISPTAVECGSIQLHCVQVYASAAVLGYNLDPSCIGQNALRTRANVRPKQDRSKWTHHTNCIHHRIQFAVDGTILRGWKPKLSLTRPLHPLTPVHTMPTQPLPSLGHYIKKDTKKKVIKHLRTIYFESLCYVWSHMTIFTPVSVPVKVKPWAVWPCLSLSLAVVCVCLGGGGYVIC